MKTSIIITLIICATIIAIVAIVCDFYTEIKVSVDNTDCNMSKKIIRLHRNYIAGILGFSIIMLITAKYGGPNNAIFEYLSFGSTITSLVLSILAIFVTVQSSSDLYKQFTRIDTATDTIENVSKKIDGTLSALKETEKKLTTTSKDISTSLENIVDKIDEKIKTRIKETESNLTERFSESMNNLFRPDVNSSQDLLYDINSRNENFIRISSSNGLLALYACVLAKNNNKKFKISDLFKGNEGYTFGFLIASISAGVLLFEHDTLNDQITVKESIFSQEQLLTEIKSRIQNQGLGSEYVDNVNIINQFFGITPLKVIVE